MLDLGYYDRKKTTLRKLRRSKSRKALQSTLPLFNISVGLKEAFRLPKMPRHGVDRWLNQNLRFLKIDNFKDLVNNISVSTTSIFLNFTVNLLLLVLHDLMDTNLDFVNRVLINTSLKLIFQRKFDVPIKNISIKLLQWYFAKTSPSGTREHIEVLYGKQE